MNQRGEEGDRMRKGFALVCALLLCVLAALPAAMADGETFDAGVLRGWDEAEGYQYVRFGVYPQEYADQPILWRVLAVRDGRALLLSELILDARPFHSLSYAEGGTNEWEESELYAWLNQEFINTAFAKSERNLLYSNRGAGKVFLPSDGELTNPAYGFLGAKYEADPNRAATATPHAFDKGLWQASDSSYSSYYTRTKPNEKNARHVSSSGALGLARIERTNVGVRPALWLNIESLPFTAGDGTMEDPFR